MKDPMDNSVLEELLDKDNWLMGLSTIAVAIGIFGEYVVHFAFERRNRDNWFTTTFTLLFGAFVLGGVVGEYIFGSRLSQVSKQIQLNAYAQVAELQKDAANARKEARSFEIQALVLKAIMADNADARDEFVRIATTGTPEEKQLIESLMPGLVGHSTPSSTPTFAGSCANPDGLTFQRLIASSEVDVRRAAISDCSQFLAVTPLAEVAPGHEIVATEEVKKIIPTLLNVASTDHSESLRAQARLLLAPTFANLPGFPPDGVNQLKREELEKWWRTNERDYDALATLAEARAVVNSGNNRLIDSAPIYDFPEPFEDYANRRLADQFRKIRDRMRSAASNANAGKVGPPVWIEHEDNTCPGVDPTFNDSMKYLAEHPERGNEQNDEYENNNFDGIRYLRTCPADQSLVPTLAKFGMSPRRLSRRYAAISVINAWTKSNLDPYDLAALGRWWSSNKDAFPSDRKQAKPTK